MKMSMTIWMPGDDCDWECEVEFTPVKETHDTWGYWGGEPGEPRHCDELIVYCDGIDVTDRMTEKQLERIEDRCLEYAFEDVSEPPDPREDR